MTERGIWETKATVPESSSMLWNHVLAMCIPALAVGAAGGRLSATTVIRALHRQNRTLVREAQRDPLTGVLNRAGLADAYTTTTDRDRFVIVVDLDTFKLVNDRHGHLTGDRILTMLGARLTELASRHDGWAGRLGGDEFALILPCPSQTSAVMAAAEAAAAITVNDTRIGSLRICGSAGIADAAAGRPWTEALGDADIALYHAKRSGGVAVFEDGMTYPSAPQPRRRARDAR